MLLVRLLMPGYNLHREKVTLCKDRLHSDRHFAVRYAAKEAFVKALGTGFDHGIRIKDVEVTTSNRKPTVQTYGRAKEIAKQMNISDAIVSLSHDGDYSQASIILLGA